MQRIPVTVLTGFLGSGKTTLVNRILSEQHGRRIAVIENEFGEIGVDHELVIGAQEEIFETSNGCVCCTVRGDLIRILTQLRKRRERFDSILIETTGLADPGPVAQTFFVDEDLREHFALDAIVTLVDARHIERQLADHPIAQEQIAFADRILLNKVDLVDAPTLERIERTVRAINGTAGLLRTQRAGVPLDQVLNLGAFDLERALTRDGAFLEPARPFEWAALCEPAAEAVELRTGAAGCTHHDHDHDHHHDHEPAHGAGDPGPDDRSAGGLSQVDLVWLPAGSAGDLEGLLESAARAFDGDAREAAPNAVLQPALRYRLPLGGWRRYSLAVGGRGPWALFTEHAPAEFGLAVDGAVRSQRSFGSHHHDLDIASVGLTEARPLDAERVNAWLSYLLQSRGPDILRMKGVLQFDAEPRRYVFHGVHMVFDGQLERPWGTGERLSRLVFIGRRLDRAELEAGLQSCIAR